MDKYLFCRQRSNHVDRFVLYIISRTHARFVDGVLFLVNKRRKERLVTRERALRHIYNHSVVEQPVGFVRVYSRCGGGWQRGELVPFVVFVKGGRVRSFVL